MHLLICVPAYVSVVLSNKILSSEFWELQNQIIKHGDTQSSHQEGDMCSANIS